MPKSLVKKLGSAGKKVLLKSVGLPEYFEVPDETGHGYPTAAISFVVDMLKNICNEIAAQTPVNSPVK